MGVCDGSADKQLEQKSFATTKLYTKWVNSCLSEDGLGNLESLDSGLADGVVLITLIQCLTGDLVTVDEQTPISRVNAVLKYLENQEITVHVEAHDIIEGDLHSILDLTWLLILHFDIHCKERACYQRTTRLGQRFMLEWIAEELPDLEIDCKRSISSSLLSGVAVHRLISKYTSFDEHEEDLEYVDVEALTRMIEKASDELRLPADMISGSDVINGEMDDVSLLIFMAVLRRKVLWKSSSDASQLGARSPLSKYAMERSSPIPCSSQGSAINTPLQQSPEREYSPKHLSSSPLASRENMRNVGDFFSQLLPNKELNKTTDSPSNSPSKIDKIDLPSTKSDYTTKEETASSVSVSCCASEPSIHGVGLVARLGSTFAGDSVIIPDKSNTDAIPFDLDRAEETELAEDDDTTEKDDLLDSLEYLQLLSTQRSFDRDCIQLGVLTSLSGQIRDILGSVCMSDVHSSVCDTLKTHVGSSVSSEILRQFETLQNNTTEQDLLVAKMRNELDLLAGENYSLCEQIDKLRQCRMESTVNKRKMESYEKRLELLQERLGRQGKENKELGEKVASLETSKLETEDAHQSEVLDLRHRCLAAQERAEQMELQLAEREAMCRNFKEEIDSMKRSTDAMQENGGTGMSLKQRKIMANRLMKISELEMNNSSLKTVTESDETLRRYLESKVDQLQHDLEVSRVTCAKALEDVHHAQEHEIRAIQSRDVVLRRCRQYKEQCGLLRGNLASLEKERKIEERDAITRRNEFAEDSKAILDELRKLESSLNDHKRDKEALDAKCDEQSLVIKTLQSQLEHQSHELSRFHFPPSLLLKQGTDPRQRSFTAVPENHEHSSFNASLTTSDVTGKANRSLTIGDTRSFIDEMNARLRQSEEALKSSSSMTTSL